MTEAEFYAYLDTCVAALADKQTALQAQYRLGEQGRWWFDQAKGELKFYTDPKQAIDWAAQVVVIGSYAPAEATWKWGHSNASLSPSQRAATAPLTALAERWGVLDFAETEAFHCEPGMAWELAAVAAAELNLLGVYRAPSSLGQHEYFLGLLALAAG